MSSPRIVDRSPLERDVDGKHVRRCPHSPKCRVITQGGEQGQAAHLAVVHQEGTQ